MGAPRLVQTARIPLEIVEEGSGPAVILLHGFPECSYSWRHQIHALADAGFRAIAPDQRGYGHSGKPAEVDAYDLVELAADVVALEDALGLDSAVVVGHDWGAPVAWHTAMLHPERVRAVAGMSIPFGGRPRRSPLASMKERLGGMFFYMLYFQEPGIAERELEANVRESLRIFYYSASGEVELGSGFTAKPAGATLFETMHAPPGLPTWLTEADLDVFCRAFEASGFRGPLNWYRNFDRTFDRTPELAEAKVRQPALFIAGERDPALIFSSNLLARMKDYVVDLRQQLLLPDAGHWVQQEKPAEVNEALIAFLRGL